MTCKIKQFMLVAKRAYSIPLTTQIPDKCSPVSSHNLKLLCSSGRLWEALTEMSVRGFDMDFEGYDTILNECVNRKAIREGQRVHAHMIKTRYLPSLYLRTRLVVFYCKCAWLTDARQVFDEMPERNVISWTAMISGYSQNKFPSDAVDLFVHMLRSDIKPNEFTFATILTCCTEENGLVLGMQVHSLILRSNYDSHIFVGSSLLDMYAKAGRIHEAHKVFSSLPDKDVVSCTAIISGYAQMGLDSEAIELFRDLQKQGMVSNYVTYTSILTALSGLAALHHGKQVHNHVLRRQIPSSHVVLQNSLIDMYAKCGNLVYARRVFDLMPVRTVVSWNAMLVGYGKHGMGAQVVELFELMRKENKQKPDSVTFLAVLSGCSHGAMEDEGMRVFNELVSQKDVEPVVEHYGCIVDLLGRGGQLEKAMKFVEKMPFEPNAAIWGSLLGACRLHRNVAIGETVGKRLLEIEPDNAGNYVILSNLYASAGRWEEVRRLRGLMHDMDVTKEPGRSWIELEQTVHNFHASDRSHPEKDQVHAKVKELVSRFKEVGYEPDLSCVVHDVDDEQKERMLLGHSEKLAMAFGLMKTREGDSLLVIKNLRICVDCHNFAKFISRIYGRHVCLRDKNRFHRIVQGKCSCGDYW